MATYPTNPPRIMPARRTSLRTRIVVLCSLWVIAIVPFVFLSRTTWFGRPLSDQQIGEYLHADEKPRQIEYALGQIGQRMARHDDSVSIWYADLVRLSTDPVEEVRATDARVMGEAADLPDLHDALIRQLRDGSQPVRLEAALSLAHARDASGRDEILALLKQPNATSDQVLRALVGLQQIGVAGDVPLVEQYESPRPGLLPDKLQQQAVTTANAIRAREQGLAK
jgi:hypothetical protein